MTDRQIDGGMTNKVIPMLCFASQSPQQYYPDLTRKEGVTAQYMLWSGHGPIHAMVWTQILFMLSTVTLELWPWVKVKTHSFLCEILYRSNWWARSYDKDKMCTDRQIGCWFLYMYNIRYTPKYNNKSCQKKTRMGLS